MTKFKASKAGVLLELLQAHLPQASKTTLRDMVRHGRVSIDGVAAARADTRVLAGQTIEIASEKTHARIRPPGRLLFADEHLLAIEKPAGALSIARRPDDETFYRSVQSYVRETSGGRARAYIVHRLDRETSGIMIFALSPETQEALQRNWRAVRKRYWALVEGRPPSDEGTIQSWLHENQAHKMYSGPPGAGAKRAVTHYRLRREHRSYALLEIEIETGRKNQIRAHLSELGCPIVGDRKYGARTNPIGRLGLHAYLLAFTHPVTKAGVRLSLPLPGAFRLRG